MKKNNQFLQGFAAACAIMARYEGGTSTNIEETFSCNFMTVAQMKSASVDEFDIEILRPIVKRIQARKKRMAQFAAEKLNPSH